MLLRVQILGAPYLRGSLTKPPTLLVFSGIDPHKVDMVETDGPTLIIYRPIEVEGAACVVRTIVHIAVSETLQQPVLRPVLAPVVGVGR